MKPWYSLLLGFFLSSATIVPVEAQITMDGTTNTNLIPTDNGIRIDEGDRAGGNLFHSFEQFSIPNGTEAFFNNANDLVNIFSRVTGGNISNIDGLIRANGQANLFLLNPAGIIFGKGASLDIGGSFVSSTADSILFTDNIEFSATDTDNPPLLTINMPIGLNLGNNPGNIVNRSLANNGRGLEVATGETITLVGGNVDLEGGRIFAPGGRVELGGLSAAGEISINADGSLIFPERVARADVTLTNSSEVNVQAAGGGHIGVNARNIEISGGELGASNLRAGITPESDSSKAQAGDIALNATDNITVNQASGVRNRVEESAVGNAGGIKITTANLYLTEGSRVDASTRGQGDAGAVIINASDTISADGETQEGLINISTGIISRIQESGVGNAGGINITTNNLYLTEGGRVSTSTFGQGNAGAIIINASDTISAEGATQEGIPSGIFSVILPEAIGDSEGITITTTNLSLKQGSRVSSRTVGTGNAGAITIKAWDTIFADGKTQGGFTSGIVSLAGRSQKGNAADIKLHTAQLSLTNEAQISVESLGQGNASNLKVQANFVALSNGASLFASTPLGTGGNIDLQISNNLTLLDNSTISARATEDANGGSIDINADFIIAFPHQNNDIIASAEQGKGGNIEIATQGIFGIEERSSTPANQTNDLDASSEFGLDGTITINQPNVNPAEGLEELATEIIDVTKLVAQNLCQQTKDSEFIVTGKGGLAPNPSQVRDGEISEVDLVEPAIPSPSTSFLISFPAHLTQTRVNRKILPERREINRQDERSQEIIVEAQGWIINERGNIELIAYSTDLDGSPPQPKDNQICHKF